MNLSLQNIVGAPSSTLTGLATATAIFAGLSSMIGGQVGLIIGGIAAAVIVVAGALAPSLTK